MEASRRDLVFARGIVHEQEAQREIRSRSIRRVEEAEASSKREADANTWDVWVSEA